MTPRLRAVSGHTKLKLTKDQGEVSSWLILAAGLCLAAIAATTLVDATIADLAVNVGRGEIGARAAGGDRERDGDGNESDGQRVPDQGDGDDSERGDSGNERQVPDRGDGEDLRDGNVEDRNPRDDGRRVPAPPGSGGGGPTSGTTTAPTSDPQGLPDPPAPPAPPSSGDGSGEHGANDGRWDRASAEVTELLAYELAAAADAIGMDNAARNMRHYLDNSGDDLNVDPTEILRDIPKFEQVVSGTINFGLRQQVDAQIAADWNGDPISFQTTTDWQTFRANQELSQDWWFGLGTFSYSVGAEVTVAPGPNGEPHVSVSYQTHIFDRYNWDGGKSVTIGPVTITDERLGQLHEVGIAQEYDVYGTTPSQTYTYEYDQAGTNATSPIDPSNGEGR